VRRHLPLAPRAGPGRVVRPRMGAGHPRHPRIVRQLRLTAPSGGRRHLGRLCLVAGLRDAGPVRLRRGGGRSTHGRGGRRAAADHHHDGGVRPARHPRV
ncbi:MAG: hypothetical protein AVDCRST_MAG57-3125, partial [uncultured Blastococcus sp.]